MDRPEGATLKLSSGARAVVPGDPSASRLLQVISSTDPDEHMPPASTGKQLSSSQMESLRRWIQEGAEWKGHWSHQSVEDPALPAVQSGGCCVGRHPLEPGAVHQVAASPPEGWAAASRSGGFPPSPRCNHAADHRPAPPAILHWAATAAHRCVGVCWRPGSGCRAARRPARGAATAASRARTAPPAAAQSARAQRTRQ